MQPHVSMGAAVADKTPNDLPYFQPHVPVLAELLCNEPPDEDLMKSERVENKRDEQTLQSYFDPKLLQHSKALCRLKFLESKMEKPCDYFKSTTKEDILPHMRKVVASWMLEVCEEQSCEEAVFPMSVSLLDRYLGCYKIKGEQLQLVACIFLLIASKTRQCNHFSLDLLSWYTDNSVSAHSLREWELTVLWQLDWDVNVITAIDFLDFFLVRSSGQPDPNNKKNKLLRRHATTFIALCATEPRFVGFKPSLIAASAIYTAMKGIRKEDNKMSYSLAYMAAVTLDELKSVSTSIDQVISTEMAVITQQTVDIPHVKAVMASTASSSKLCSVQSTSGQKTPTDVQDVIV